MNKTLLNILKFLAFLSIGIGLMALAFKGIDLDEIIEGFKKANYWWVGLAIVFGAISHLVRALRWNLLIQPLGYKPNIILSFFAVMIGYLGNLGIPRLGEVLRPGVLTRYEKIPLNSLLGTILIERAIDMIFLIFLLMATLMWEFDRLNEFVLKTMVGWMTTKFTSSLDNVQMALLGLGVVVGLVLLFLLSRYLLKRSRYWEKARELVKGLVVGMKSIGKMEHNMGFVIYTFIMWFCYFLIAWLCVFSIEATSNLGPLAGLSILAIGSLGIVAPVQGGIGAYHFIVPRLLLLYSIELKDGLVYATIVHATQTVFVIIAGVISIIAAPYIKPNNNE